MRWVPYHKTRGFITNVTGAVQLRVVPVKGRFPPWAVMRFEVFVRLAEICGRPPVVNGLQGYALHCVYIARSEEDHG